MNLEANGDSGVWPLACMVQLIPGRHVVPRLSILVDVGTGVLVCLGVSWLFLGRLASTEYGSFETMARLGIDAEYRAELTGR